MNGPGISGLPPAGLVLTVLAALAIVGLVSWLLWRRSEARIRRLAAAPIDDQRIDELVSEASARLSLLDSAYSIAGRRLATGERPAQLLEAASGYCQDVIEALEELVDYVRASLAKTPAPAAGPAALLQDETLGLELYLLLGAARRAGRALQDAPAPGAARVEDIDEAVGALKAKAAAVLGRSELCAGLVAAAAERRA